MTWFEKELVVNGSSIGVVVVVCDRGVQQGAAAKAHGRGHACVHACMQAHQAQHLC